MNIMGKMLCLCAMSNVRWPLEGEGAKVYTVGRELHDSTHRDANLPKGLDVSRAIPEL